MSRSFHHNTTTFGRTDWSASKPTLQSSTTGGSGPSSKDPAAITSTWGIGWWTPALMILCYVLALLIAIAHLLLFRFIDGKQADGPQEVVSQTFVATASNVLANAFGICLRSALGIAFVQHLWRLLRASAMKVSTIEDLFSVRSNPFLLFKIAVLRAAPVLCVCVIIVLGSQVATSFPPGAINVVTSQQTSFSTVGIPFFNASFMGNGSGVDASAYSFTTIDPDVGDGGFVPHNFDGFKGSNLITRIARQVLISGEALDMVSPCGVNCSYVMEFEGPWIECENSSSTFVFQSNATNDVRSNNFTIYDGQWFAPSNADSARIFYNGTYTLANFSASFLTPISINYTVDSFGEKNATANIQKEIITCSPARAAFTVNNTYTNNILNRTYSANPISKLINLALLTHEGVVPVPGLVTLNDTFGTQPANWTETTQTYYRDMNIMAIFDSVLSWVDGSFVGYLAASQEVGNLPKNQTTAIDLTTPSWEDIVSTSALGVSHSSGAVDNPLNIVDSTRFNNNFGQYDAFNSSGPQFNVTQDLLNDYLFQMTSSLMVAYRNWNTTANATVFTPTNIYSFNQPLSLILPYFLTLAVSFPFMILGSIALIRNGVSANDGFIQLIATSTGSAALDNAAAGACLGGSESVPRELKDLKIRFGELIGRDDVDVKRAGFGIEEEIVPLTKGATYGIAKWI